MQISLARRYELLLSLIRWQHLINIRLQLSCCNNLHIVHTNFNASNRSTILFVPSHAMISHRRTTLPHQFLQRARAALAYDRAQPKRGIRLAGWLAGYLRFEAVLPDVGSSRHAHYYIWRRIIPYLMWLGEFSQFFLPFSATSLFFNYQIHSYIHPLFNEI